MKPFQVHSPHHHQAEAATRPVVCPQISIMTPLTCHHLLICLHLPGPGLLEAGASSFICVGM